MELMAYMSPTCSMIGAIATGAMNKMACQENDIGASLGIANHEASATGVKSIASRKKSTATT